MRRVCGLHALRAQRKTLRFVAVAEDFKNQFMLASQALNAALLGDSVAGAWAGSMKGQAGVLVSAGPSLSKNAHVLSAESFSDRFVTVATAAAAGSLRAMDLRPQLVATTSDLSAATRQWLGSFNANIVRGGGKYNPTDFGARADEVGVMVALPVDVADSIVGYILLRYLGCDPVVLVGFDLAFIDGVAHAKGNELDLQWSTQISTVRSWDWWHTQRIFGNSKQLQREKQTNETGVVGEFGAGGGLKESSEDQERSVVTNQALRRERALLEAAFAQDTTLGLRVIDATEGGVTKRNALVEPLAQCLATYALTRNPKVKWNQRAKSKVVKAPPSADVLVGPPAYSDAGAQNIASTQKSLSNITTEQIAPRVVAVIAIDPLRGGTGLNARLNWSLVAALCCAAPLIDFYRAIKLSMCVWWRPSIGTIELRWMDLSQVRICILCMPQIQRSVLGIVTFNRRARGVIHVLAVASPIFACSTKYFPPRLRCWRANMSTPTRCWCAARIGLWWRWMNRGVCAV